MSFSAHSWFQLPSDSTVEVFEYLAIGAVLFKPPALGSSHLVDQLAFYPVTVLFVPIQYTIVCVLGRLHILCSSLFVLYQIHSWKAIQQPCIGGTSCTVKEVLAKLTPHTVGVKVLPHQARTLCLTT